MKGWTLWCLHGWACCGLGTEYLQTTGGSSGLATWLTAATTPPPPAPSVPRVTGPGGATETAPGTREEDSAEIPRHHPTVKYRFHQFITLHCAVFLYFQKEDYDGNVGHILISLSAIYHFSRLFAESLQVNVICHVKMWILNEQLSIMLLETVVLVYQTWTSVWTSTGGNSKMAKD